MNNINIINEVELNEELIKVMNSVIINWLFFFLFSSTETVRLVTEKKNLC